MARNRIDFVDLTDEAQVAAAEAAYDEDYRAGIDLTQDEAQDNASLPSAQRARRNNNTRTPTLNATHRSARTSGDFCVQSFVELKSPIGEWNIRFVEVKQIWVNRASQAVILRGIPYSRNMHLHGRLKFVTNEICQILEVDDDDHRPVKEQAMIDIRPADILGSREFHKTNTDYGADRNCRFGNDPLWFQDGMSEKRARQRLAPLTCRWKMALRYTDGRFRRASKPYGSSLLHLTESEIADPAYRTSDDERRRAWLKRDPAAARNSPGFFTFGDAFSGAGGASRGAEMAGLRPTIAIEKWDAACETYRRNFPLVNLFEEDISDFITHRRDFSSIDVLHISPPCQFFSPARVNDGQHDEDNRAATYACAGLLEKIRPRIFTMEQTYGLLQSRYMPYFNMLIGDFTRLGYSVQWRTRVEFVRYGLPQKRKRLIIIGCASGEKMPAWPAPSHGDGLTPFVTELQAIGRLPRNDPLHDLRSAPVRPNGVARDPNQPLGRTIVCGGAQGVIHYNGERDYTLREFATLQGFPLNHDFFGGSRGVIKKQIGNAFPPVVSRAIFKSILTSLQDQDRRNHHIRNDHVPPHMNRGLNPFLDVAAEVPIDPGPEVVAEQVPLFLNAGLDEDEALAVAIEESSQTRGAVQQPPVIRHRTDDRVPPYSRFNRGLDPDQALQAAVIESRQAHATVQRPRVIVIEDSDSEELQDTMGSLSVEPSPPTTRAPLSSRPELGTPSNPGISQSSLMRDWSGLGITFPFRPPQTTNSSRESSATLENCACALGNCSCCSPSSGPAKRKHDAVGTDDREKGEKKKCDKKVIDVDDSEYEVVDVDSIEYEVINMDDMEQGDMPASAGSSSAAASGRNGG